MKYIDDFKDYQILDMANGEKLERIAVKMPGSRFLTPPIYSIYKRNKTII